MTKQDIMTAFEMRIDGFTYQQIADTLHYSKRNIRDTLSKICTTNAGVLRRNEMNKYRYPNLVNCIYSVSPSFNRFCKQNKIGYATLMGVLKGRNNAGIKLKKKLILRTGQSEEYLFSTK